MSTVFEVPCPDCDRQLVVGNGGNLECPICQRAYRSRMGLLYPLGEAPATRLTVSATRRKARPAASVQS
jgi:endogenous inhibitor of DNA gyrase (YacG/DUF329 family)